MNFSLPLSDYQQTHGRVSCSIMIFLSDFVLFQRKKITHQVHGGGGEKEGMGYTRCHNFFIICWLLLLLLLPLLLLLVVIVAVVTIVVVVVVVVVIEVIDISAPKICCRWSGTL